MVHAGGCGVQCPRKTYELYKVAIEKRKNEVLCVPQDVDSAYLVKADLEDKVGALTDEINFLRTIYDEVMHIHLQNQSENYILNQTIQFFFCKYLTTHFPTLVRPKQTIIWLARNKECVHTHLPKQFPHSSTKRKLDLYLRIRNCVSCRPALRTRPSLCKWTTHETSTWIILWPKSRLNTRRLQPGAVKRLNLGTSPR